MLDSELAVFVFENVDGVGAVGGDHDFVFAVVVDVEYGHVAVAVA